MVIFTTDEPVSADDDTAPLPVVSAEQPPPASVIRPRGPFEPPEQSAGPGDADAGVPVPAAPGADQDSAAGAMAGVRGVGQVVAVPVEVEAPGAAKLDQIKDLYLTAEAIGDDALAQHFQQVSDRQRQLIKEYFDQATANRTDSPGQN